ncbi:hypothetical protein RSAG8_01709, partial [Rhizoctonia solani AG-8 WAC10335]
MKFRHTVLLGMYYRTKSPLVPINLCPQGCSDGHQLKCRFDSIPVDEKAKRIETPCESVKQASLTWYTPYGWISVEVV